MGYNYYGYGPSPYEGIASIAIFMVLAFIAALVLSFFVYHRFIAVPEGKKLKVDTSASFMERFLRFKHLIVGDVMRWFYVFTALLVAFEGVVITISMIAMVGRSAGFLFGALLNVGVVLLIELMLRVWYELMMLTVLIARDTSGIHDMLAERYGYASEAPAYDDGSQMPAMPQQPVAPTPAPAPEPASSYWTCPLCGTADNKGAFCKHCGTPRQ